MFKTRVIFYSIISIFSLEIMAQDGTDPKVIDDYKPKIMVTEKRATTPVITPPSLKKFPAFKYPVTEYYYPVLPTITFAPAREMDKNLPKRLNNNLFKLGFGFPVTPMFEFNIASTKSTKSMIGVQGNYLSTTTSDYKNYSDMNFGMFGKRYFKGSELGAKLNYETNSRSYYGYNHDSMPEAKSDSVNLKYNTIATELNFNTYEKGKNKAQFQSGLKYHYFNTNMQNQENFIDVNTSYSWNSNKNNRIVLGLRNTLDLYGDSFNYKSRNIFGISPEIQMKRKNYELNIGLNGQIYTKNKVTTAKLFPIAKLRYHFADSDVDAIAEVSGNNEMRTLRNETRINNFLGRNVELKNTINKFGIMGGFEAKLSSALQGIATISYHSYRDLPVYLTDTLDTKSFKIFYDNANVFGVKVALNYNMSEKVMLNATLKYNKYSFANFEKPYQYPSTEISVGGQYIIAEKITFKADLLFVGARNAKIAFDTVETRLPTYVDFNLSLDYRVRKSLSVFIMLNNIASAKYQRWYNYPVYSINGIAGITFSF